MSEKILKIVEHRSTRYYVTTDDPVWPNCVRLGKDNWERTMGESQEPLYLSEDLEAEFQNQVAQLPPPATCSWEKVDGAHGYRVWKGSCGRLGIRPAHQEYPTEEDLYCPSCGKLISVPEEVLKQIRLRNEKEQQL